MKRCRRNHKDDVGMIHLSIVCLQVQQFSILEQIFHLMIITKDEANFTGNSIRAFTCGGHTSVRQVNLADIDVDIIIQIIDYAQRKIVEAELFMELDLMWILRALSRVGDLLGLSQKETALIRAALLLLDSQLPNLDWVDRIAFLQQVGSTHLESL